MADRVTAEMNTGRDARILAYSLAAGATALSAGAADAAIQYSGIQDIAIEQFASQDLNLDGDAYNDILLKNYVFSFGNYQGVYVDFAPGKVVSFNAGLNYVTALSAGDLIDETTAGPAFEAALSYGAMNPNGQFDDVTGAYIGLAFPINAVNHYGWVRVDINNAAGTFVIKDWAYEDVPGVGILAGASSSVLNGDLNGDGFVGLGDLDIVLGHWNAAVTAGDLLSGDPSGDGYVGLDDLDTVLGHWNAGTPPAGVAVPEPGALSFLAAGAGGVTLWRRRR